MIDWYTSYDEINAELRKLAAAHHRQEEAIKPRIPAQSGEDCFKGLLYPGSIKPLPTGSQQ